ncbi:FAD-binding oxidoreductase [Aspergillus affinis]|uniref:FAD-binding oxidoreductase n=1 Tax=Aspergillus affinis TaxID=1070780 RepID=UPI0022FEC53A|nr:FAD-binding domain-containing protein [Aspergillus affinis]KAI9036824.1 FAD-binding domain-containing protein [Aspergillus affinis]
MPTIWRAKDSKEAYDSARIHNVFNMERPSHFPRAIVKATCAQDVIDAVQTAITEPERCQVAVRSGGHSFFVWSLHDNSILVDLGDWKEMAVDANTGIAEVTPGVTGAELNQYLRSHHGMFFPVGHYPDVALGGFLLHGGQGWNCRKNWGYACDRVVAVEVVTGQGELLLCNEDQNEDLLFTAKGAGPLFPGIVTKFYLKLMPDPTGGLRTSGYIYPVSSYHDVFNWVQSILPSADQDTEIVVVAFYPEKQHEPCLKVHFVTMKSNSEAEYTLRQLHQTRPRGIITEWVCKEESLESLFDSQVQANPQEHYYYVDNYYISNLADVKQALKIFCLSAPKGKSFAFWYPLCLGNRQNVSDMSLDFPGEHYLAVYAIGKSKEEATLCRKWAEKTMAKFKDHAVGSYLGECDLKMGHDWNWGRNAERVATVCRRWDPDSLFCTVHRGRDALEQAD